MPLNEHEIAVLDAIRRWRDEPPGLAARGFAMAANPATRAVQSVIPASVFRRALRAAHAAGRWSADRHSVLTLAGVDSLERLRAGALIDCDRLAARVRRRAMAAAGTGGVLFGVAGAPGLLADAGALIVLALRSIHRIGLCYGVEDQSDPPLAIGLFALASANTVDEKRAALAALLQQPGAAALIDAAWRDGIERAAERELAKEAAVLSVQTLTRQLGVNLGWRKAGGALPVIGAAVGGSVNAWYLHDVARTAQYWFQALWLAERYGPAALHGALSPDP